MPTITGIVTAAELLAPVGKRPSGIAPGHNQLDQSFGTDSEDEQVVHGNSLPAQQQQLEAEARPHREHHAQENLRAAVSASVRAGRRAPTPTRCCRCPAWIPGCAQRFRRQADRAARSHRAPSDRRDGRSRSRCRRWSGRGRPGSGRPPRRGKRRPSAGRRGTSPSWNPFELTFQPITSTVSGKQPAAGREHRRTGIDRWSDWDPSPLRWRPLRPRRRRTGTRR